MRAFLVLLWFCLLGIAGAQPESFVDPSEHQIRFIEVEPGVKLEVLDWGGSGETMVLLAGLGDNAHIFDDFAYQFNDRFRVLAITRRGFGHSSQPDTGYDVETRAQDDLRVLDALHIDRAIFVGHSMAGDELSKLGARHGERVSKLVYLDACDYGVHSTLAQPPGPEFSDRDVSSVECFLAANARFNGTRPTRSSIYNGYQISPSGQLVDALARPESSQRLKAGSEQAEYDRIQAPALAFYAPLSLEKPWAFYSLLTPAQQQEYRRAIVPLIAWQADVIERFRKGVKHGRVVLLPPGTPHYIFVSNEAQVVQEMRDFLLGR